MNIETESKDTNVGERLYSLRKHPLLSRGEFCLKHNIPDRILRALEFSLVSINLKYTNKLIEAFKAENIFCTKEWLLAGTGPLSYSSPNLMFVAVTRLDIESYSTNPQD